LSEVKAGEKGKKRSTRGFGRNAGVVAREERGKNSGLNLKKGESILKERKEGL